MDAPVRILILHGPNLNLLGSREPEQYGHETLSAIDARLHALAAEQDAAVECFQSNAEHALVERIQQARTAGFGGIVINPAAFTHTSVAIRDALAAVGLPFVEVHLSNPDAREPFRHTSLVADLAAGRVAGFGGDSYLLALSGLITVLRRAASE
ncbi:MAG: type II 3-dehydroquinate dehydratase [Gammaproteobacteria bacterium]|nr:type II 3-dehydroquinate dehydratase [Gammaproteobacteria bacterium]